MNFYKFLQVSLVISFCVFVPVGVEAVLFYLVPESQTVYQDDSFIVEVKIDTEGEEINALEVGLTFPSDLIEAIDFSKGNSILTIWPEEPKIQGKEINFLGGKPGGFNGAGSLAKITFLGKEIGKSEISFKENSKVLLNDGKGTPAKLNFWEGNYEIIKKPKNLPVISSESHPDQNKWYSTTTLQLYWDLIEGAEYSYLLSYDPLAEPDEIADKPEGELMWMGDMEYKGLEKDGIYYFALKQKLPGEDWQKSVTYRAMIDATSPEPFELKIGKDPSIFEGKYFLSFAVQDKMSGIDYYKVKEGKRDFKRAASPYLLEDQSLVKKIIVRAYDKAGNYQESEIKPPLKITWKDGLYIFLILVGMGLIWWIIQNRNKFLISILITLTFFFVFAPDVFAQSASLYLSPSSGSFLVGSTFSVSVFVNTEGNEINVVWAELKFPPEILQVTSPTAGTSFIAEWLTPPNYSNQKGIVSFRGGVPGGITTSAGLISSITFRAVASGLAKVEFREGSKVLLDDGKGTDILTSARNGEYHILVLPPEGPKVFSPTHPNPNVWYSDSSPSFSWEKERGVTDFSWSFDQNPKGRPDGISEGIETLKSFTNTPDGIWYFHIRQKKEGVWGKTSHVQVRIDITPPNEFTPRVETYTRLIGYQTMVYFETTDNFSGISHFEVSLIDLSAPEPTRSFFTEELSPYRVPFKKAGKYNVIIKAVDKTGNARETEARFRLVTPLISHIEGKGLEIRGLFLPWWLVWILLFILLGSGGIVSWWLYKRYLRNK